MKKFLKLIVGVCAAVLGLVGALMIFAPALKVTMPGMDPVKGSDIAFGGYAVVNENTFGMSAYILALILPVIGVVFAVLAAFGKLGKAAPIVAAICFIVGAIIFFLPEQVMMPNTEGHSVAASAVDAWRKEYAEIFEIDAGAIVGGLFCILAACGSVATLFLKKKAD